MNRKVTVSFRGSQIQKRPGKMESEDEPVSIFVHRNEAGVGGDNNCVIKIHSEYENGQRGSVKTDCAASLSRLTLKFKKVTLHYSGRAALPNNTAASQHKQPPYCCCCSPHAAHCTVSPPLPLHFVARVTLTLNSQVGRRRGRDTEAVARTAGVFPGILRLDPEDDKGAVDENADSELQITARGHETFCHTVKHTNRTSHPFHSFFFLLNYIKVP